MTEKCLIGSLHDFPQGEVRASMLADGTVVAVFNVEGNVYVTADRCTHGEASLSDEGKLCGDVDFDGVKAVASHITPVPGGVSVEPGVLRLRGC